MALRYIIGIIKDYEPLANDGSSFLKLRASKKFTFEGIKRSTYDWEPARNLMLIADPANHNIRSVEEDTPFYINGFSELDRVVLDNIQRYKTITLGLNTLNEVSRVFMGEIQHTDVLTEKEDNNS
jgi:hypothetical protein